MQVGSEILQEFETIYSKKTKHRKKCLLCNKLIEDGCPVRMRKVKTTKYYPVKGLMKFITWTFVHTKCLEEATSTNPKEEEKMASKKQATKIETKATAPKKSKTSAVAQLLEKLIAAGKYTRKELMEQISKQLPEASISTINTYLTDVKNPKYNPLSKLAVVNGNVYKFKASKKTKKA